MQDVTLANPVALYIDSFTPVNFVTPDGANALDFWKVTRGAEGFAVRAEFEVPASKPYVVGAQRSLSWLSPPPAQAVANASHCTS